MPDMMADEDFLLALLNPTPVIDGMPADELDDAARGRSWLVGADGLGTDAARWCSMAACGNRMKARRHYQRARNAIQGG
jgi:hypothetical protein